jgi:hypothetical protein
LRDQLEKLEFKSHIWGITTEAVFLYVSDIEMGSDDRVDLVKLETIRTNARRDDKSYEDALHWLSNYLGLLQKDKVSPLGKVVLVNKNPLALIRACLVSSDYRIRSFVTEAVSKKIKVVLHSELETYFPGEGKVYGKLMASFGILRFGERIAELNIPIVEELGNIPEFPQSVGNWLCTQSYIRSIIGEDDDILISRITRELLSSLEIPFEESIQRLDIEYALMHVKSSIPQLFGELVDNPSIITEIMERVRSSFADENHCIESLLVEAPGPAEQSQELELAKIAPAAEKYGLIPDEVRRIVSQISIVSNVTSAAFLPYFQEILTVNKDQLAALLGEVFRGSIALSSHTAKLLRRFRVLDGLKGDLADYWRSVLRSYSENRRREEELTKAEAYLLKKGGTNAEIVRANVDKVKSSLLQKVLSRNFSPFYFVYTLLNPASLGTEVTDKYVAGDEAIRREIQKLSTKWPLLRSESSSTYVDSADRLFSIGLERDLDTKELRIMTPYSDDILGMYVSVLRRLIERGYKLRVLMRLSRDRQPWEILKEALLKGLGEKSKSVEIRTYTRFKEFLPVSKLSRPEDGAPGEFGVHAKLLVIGDSHNGAVLLGSANLLENSFKWNPECGLYTEDPTFVESAKIFFDFVWELSENDSLDLSGLSRIPKGPFFPQYYSK